MNQLQKLHLIASTPYPPGVVQDLNGIGYLSGETVIDILNAATGGNHSIEFSQPWVEPFSDPNKPAITVKCRLTIHDVLIPETGKTRDIVREGFGTDTVKYAGSIEMVTKSAQTDAFKKAVLSFGIANQIIMNAKQEKVGEIQFSRYLSNGWYLWPSELQGAYRDEWAIIAKARQTFGITDQFLHALVYRYTDGADTYITPNNIVTVAKKLSELLENGKAAAKSATAPPVPTVDGIAPPPIPDFTEKG